MQSAWHHIAYDIAADEPPQYPSGIAKPDQRDWIVGSESAQFVQNHMEERHGNGAVWSAELF
jgi:hypothetical protein